MCVRVLDGATARADRWPRPATHSARRDLRRLALPAPITRDLASPQRQYAKLL